MEKEVFQLTQNHLRSLKLNDSPTTKTRAVGPSGVT